MGYTQQDIDLTKKIIEAKLKSAAGWRPVQLAAMNLLYPGSRQFEADLVKKYTESIQKLWDQVQAGIDTGVFGSTFVSLLSGSAVQQAASEFVQLTMNLLSSPIILKVKTLPMFHLSYGSAFMKPVVVYINSNTMVKPFHNVDVGMNPYDSVMSGMYLLTGFKHVISNKGAYSQFVLIRDPFEFSSYLFDDFAVVPSDQPSFGVRGVLGQPGTTLTTK